MEKKLSNPEVKALAENLLQGQLSNLTESSLERVLTEVRKRQEDFRMTSYEMKLHQSIIKQLELSK